MPVWWSSAPRSNVAAELQTSSKSSNTLRGTTPPQPQCNAAQMLLTVVLCSDPLAAFTRGAPATAAARARASAAQQAAAAPNALSHPSQQQQHIPGPGPPPVNLPPQQAGFSVYENKTQGFNRGRGRGHPQYLEQQQHQPIGGTAYGGPPQTRAAPPAVSGQQQWAPAPYVSPQGLGPQPGFTGQPPGHMTWQQQQLVGAQGSGRGQGGGAYGNQQGGRGRGGQYTAGGRGRGGYSSNNNSEGYQQGGGRGRGRSPKMPRLDTGTSSSSGSLPDGARFFKKSFLDDPWEPLMRQLLQQQQQQQQQ